MARRKRADISVEEWRTCTDPYRLVRWSRQVGNARKYLLLGCAIVRNWPGGVRTKLGLGMLEEIEALARRRGGLERSVKLVEDVLSRCTPLLTSGSLFTESNLQVCKSLGDDRHWFVHVFNNATFPGQTSKTLVNVLISNAVAVARIHATSEATAEVETIRRSLVTRQAGSTIVSQFAAVREWLFGPTDERLRDGILERLPSWLRVGVTTLVQARTKLQVYRSTQNAATVRTQLSALVREVFGYPVRPWCVQSDWLARHDDAVRGIAEHIDQTGNFDELPILGDALEDAGCTDATALEHCRSEEPHSPGCWVLDAVLQR